MEIFIDNVNGKNFTVYLGASDRFVDLKAKIQAETNVRGGGKAINYAGTQMRMNWRLSSYGLRDGCTVHLTGRPLFGTWPSSNLFVDLENKDALQRIPLTYTTGQKWSEVYRGISVEGKCTSMSCEAFGRRVISPRCFRYFDIPMERSFNITTDKAPCPVCRCSVEATTCGFVDCLWMYTGRRKGSEADITSEWQLASDDEYERFREAGNMVDWEVLIISAKPSLNREECHMCLCGMDFTATKERLACGCRFHSRCVAKWKERETGCPNCRLEESTSHTLLEVSESTPNISPVEVVESIPNISPVEVIDSKPKKRKSFIWRCWRCCQG